METRYPLEKSPLLQPRETNQSLDVLILAAGLGTRMKSARAKVLHEIGGLPLIIYVCRTARSLEPERIYVVVGHQAAEVEKAVQNDMGDLAEFVMQTEQRGTGDAVMAARASSKIAIPCVLVLSGDVPLIRSETLESFIENHKSSRAACSVLSVRLENPTGYGRIVRDDNDLFARIVEQKDATPEEQKIKEINSGIYCFDSRKLFAALERVKPTNKQGEYYLTDVPEILLSDGEKVNVYLHGDAREVSGINTRAELAEFENLLRRNTIRKLDDGGRRNLSRSIARLHQRRGTGGQGLRHLSGRCYRRKNNDRRKLRDSIGHAHHKFAFGKQRRREGSLCDHRLRD